MKTKGKKVTVNNRKPYKRLSEREKGKIVHEVNSGLIGHKACAKKYSLSRNSFSAWITDFSSFAVKSHQVDKEDTSDLAESSKTRIPAKQVKT